MPLSNLVSSSAPLDWVFTGDSITQGVSHTHGERCWVEHVHERIRYELGRPLDAIVNTGIAGWTAPQVLGEFDRLVGRFDPDVVSIALGMNDCMGGRPGRPHFAAALGRLVRQSQELGAQVVLHTPNTIALGAANIDTEVAAYAQLVRDVAADYDVPLVDHHTHWAREYHGGPPLPWLDEAVHPNGAGHRAMADLTLTTLGLGSLGTYWS